MELREQVKEAEVTKVSERLRDFGLVVDEVKYGRSSIKDIDSIVATGKAECVCPPEGKATLPPENFFILTSLKS